MNKKLVLKMLLLVSMTTLFIMASYSWFGDEASPSISQSGIQVTSAEGLLIKLTPDSAGRTNVNLNTIITDFQEFELKQVSSLNGTTFYGIDFNEGLSLSNPSYILLPTATNDTSIMKINGYIDYDFYLQAEDYAKHVYIHKDSYFTGPSSNSIRVAITIQEGNNAPVTYIFGEDEENGIIGYTTHAVVQAGQFNYANPDPSFFSNQVVHDFSYKDGGRGTNDSDPIDTNKLLTTVATGTTKKVNVKVWLEGGDEDCTNLIAGTELDLLIKFGSANVLLTAPILTPGVNNTIQGLTTAMEWADDNTTSTVWTAVTNPTQQFIGKQSVYVRIARVDGVSPESYATLVTF